MSPDPAAAQPPDPTDAAVAVGRAWLEASGLLGQVDETIHPADEMYLTIADYPRVEPQSYRLEYFRAGAEALSVLQNVLRTAGRELADVEAMLDFACGYGRFTRHLVGALDPGRIWSADVLTGGVEFVGQRFGVHTLLSHTDPARLELPRKFPLIWVGSLFSHLPRHSFAAWCTRLLEALTDDGLLVFSTHGPDVVDSVPKDPSGFTFVPQSESLTLDAQEYGATFVTHAVLRQIVADCGAPHLHGTVRDLWWIQDVWAASRRPVPGLERLARAPIVRGKLDHLKIEADPAGQTGAQTGAQTRAQTRAWIGGWTLTAGHDQPVREVQVLVDGQPVARAELLPPGPGGEQHLPGCVHAGWRLHGDVTGLPAGPHVLAVTAVAAGGKSFCIDARRFEFVPGQNLLWTEA